MTNVIRNLHRLTGAAGSPGSVQPSGVIALNFAPSGTPELWASDGSAWKQLNPAGSIPFATSADVLTGTEAAEAISPASLAAAAAATSAGAADANKYPRLGAAGLLSETFLSRATGAQVITGTSNAVFLTPSSLAGGAVASSAGAADANKYVRLDAAGKIAASLLDSTALTTALAPVTTVTSAGAADANKYVTLDANGKIDASVLSVTAMEYKGSRSATVAPPASNNVGDTYVITTAGTWQAGWGLSGTAAVGDLVIFNGTGWDRIQASNPDLSGFMPLGGTAGVAGAAMSSGAVITMNPAAAGNTVFNAATGAITNAVISCGVF